MALTLDAYTARIRSLLSDTADLPMSFSDASITAGLSQALGEVNMVSGVGWVIAGLDGQIISTVPDELDTALTWGAAAYAALGRALDEAEQFRINPTVQALSEWGEGRLKDYRRMLHQYNPTYVFNLDDAQANLLDAQAAHETGKESREAAAAAQAGADRVAEAQRLDALRHGGTAWGKWSDPVDIGYPDGYERIG